MKDFISHPMNSIKIFPTCDMVLLYFSSVFTIKDSTVIWFLAKYTLNNLHLPYIWCTLLSIA